MGREESLAGKAMLLTGAAKRVGAAIARALHAAGADVIVHYHSSGAEAAALASELDAARAGSAVALQADLLDVGALEPLVERARAQFGRLDGLVNNASSFYSTPFGEITTQHWDDLVGTNLKAPLFLAQAAAPELRRTRGLILNIADIHGLRPLRRFPLYSTAKAGLVMLTRALARELAPEVRVNAIAPGPVLWPEGGIGAEAEAKILDRTLLKRRGSPEDIARAALFFAAEAPYVTGQVLAVDGGRSVNW